MKKMWFAYIVLLGFYILFSTAVFGQNSGWFTPYWYSNPGAWAEAIAIGDVNNDGRNDVVMTTRGGDASVEDKLLVYHQNSSGGLNEEFIIKDLVGPVYGSVGIGDMNNDGRNDVVVSTSQGIAVYYQNASGSLNNAVELVSAESNKLRVADLNNDGNPDVVSIGWSTEDVDIFIQTGGVLAFNNTYNLIYNAFVDLEVGDMDGDGYNDIVVTSGSGLSNTISIIFQDPAAPGTFINPAYYDGSDIPMGCAIGDVNNDGLNDLAVANKTVEVFYQNSGHTLTTPPTSYDISISCNDPVLVGDVNRDSRLDVLVVSASSLSVLFQQGTGLLGGEGLYSLPYATWLNPHGVALGDINNDGWDDLVCANYNYGLVVSYGWDGSTETIAVRNPNGGSYEIGSNISIEWGTFGDIAAVDISYSINGGTSWTLIESNVDSNDGGSYLWNVPYNISPLPADNCLVRVSESGGTTRGVSVWPFSITDDGVPRISVTLPNGGESLVANNPYNITWTTTGSVGDVKIEFSSNNGTDWTQIATGEPNDGSYTWTVPNTVSSQCLVRISEAADNDPTDTSDANFTIYEPGTEVINVISPNGGEVLTGGALHSITWNSTGTISAVRLEYSTNNGISWTTIATATNTGSYAWVVPNISSSQCLVRISDAADGIPTDQSNNVFSIGSPGVATITVVSPNGGNFYCIGKSTEIKWASSGTVGNVCLQYSINNGSTWKNIVGSTPNDGSYTWTIPNTPSSQCLVKISDAADGDPWDVSDGVFTIAECGATLSITSPKGGETWQVGSLHNITWVSGENVGPNLKLEYSTNNQSTWNTIVSSTANDGAFSWTIPNTPSTTCNVKISDAADGTPSNISYGSFAIVTGSVTPEIDLNHSNLYFGSLKNSAVKTGIQTVIVNNSGIGILHWQASVYDLNVNDSDTLGWLKIENTSGIQSGWVDVYVEPLGMPVGTYTGAVKFSDPNAANSPQLVNVSLQVYDTAGESEPLGFFETPLEGSTVMSSIPVTGWTLDDIGIDKVTLWRNPVPGEGEGEVYIGDAVLVEGARPDVEQAYPGYPLGYKAGWGYMMLTNMLPNGGNGTYTLHAYARDLPGHLVHLGSKTITVNNAQAVKPFGALDTPPQGGEATGSKYRTNGWALTPMPNKIPIDGSTINVYIDGQNLGSVHYNIYRKDVAVLFPGYANITGAHGYYDFNTTVYESGLHTIQWIVTDNAGNTDGIGSRYFTIKNAGFTPTSAGKSNGPLFPGPGLGKTWTKPADLLKIPLDRTAPVEVTIGYKEEVPPVKMTADREGLINLTLRQDERLVLQLNSVGAEFHAGYLRVSDRLRPLPPGASLDSHKGIFYWQPGPASFGKYSLVFISTDKTGRTSQKTVMLEIIPK